MNPHTLPSPVFRKFMIVLASIICVFYLAYRALFTFNLSTPYAVFASLFLYVGEFFGIVNLLLYFLQVWEVDEPGVEPVLEGRTVDVLVPTYNEDPQLLRATLEACIRMDYPHKTYVLDDGRRPEVEALARELGVIYISRPDNRHAKAGNLNNALEQTGGEFVVVLDADHVPEPHFITRLIGYFANEKVAFVQTPHAFYNFDSFQARLDHKNRRYWEEGDLFYRVIQPGRNKWNAPIFAGSAAMFRRSALKEIGYIATETITEDLHTGLRLHARGWNSIAISERLIAGQAPPDITTFHSQRLRWGEGNLSIMAYDNPLTVRGLNLPQRFCYFGSMIHWASGVFKLAIYLTPILMLFSGVPPVREFSWNLIAVILTYLFLSLYAMKVVSNGYGSIINSELFSMVNFWTQCKATFRAMFRRSRQRFVVTRKRGPQSKSIWPFVRPQTYIIILSVLAIVWGWLRLSLDLNPIRAVIRLLSRINLDITQAAARNLDHLIDGTLLNYPIVVGAGISDDYFKPVVPTIWCLIFFWLAYKVTQRAFWPADRRFSTRHQVHLPVEYESPAGNGTTVRHAVTVDLNDTGMALVAYESLPLHAVLRFTIRGAGEVIKLRGEVRSAASVARGPTTEGFRYGIQFRDLTAPQIDTINRICLHYAVPRMFDEYERGNRNTFWNRLKLWQSRGMAQRRNVRRNPFSLPLIVNTGSSEETTMYSTTEDVSRVAAAALFENEVSQGTPVGFLLATPLGDIRGTGVIIRSQPRVIAGRTYYRGVLEYTDFEGQGRTTLQSLVNPNENSPLTPVLKPDRKTFLPNMRVPIIVGLLIASLLVIAQMKIIFPFYYKEDEVLKQMVDSDQPPTDEQLAEYKRILAQTLQEQHPSTDRLVLLMALGNKLGEKHDLEQVTQFIALRDPRNLRLAKALVIAYDKTKKYAEAEKEYKRLMALAERGYLSPSDTMELEKAGARVAVHSGHYKEAIERFREIYKQEPNNQDLRNEYAGVCNTAGDYAEAIRVLESGSIDVEGRKLLIAAYFHEHRYGDAERAVKLLLQETNNDVEALKLQAEIAAARKNYDVQKQILEMIKQRNPNPEPDVLVRLAHAEISLGEYDQAIEELEPFFKTQNLRDDAIDAFVYAASLAKGLDKSMPGYNAALAKQVRQDADMLYTKAINEQSDRQDFAIFLTRLAWIYQRLGETDRSTKLVRRALTIMPANENARQQLAGILLQAGRPADAARVLGDSNSLQSRKLLAGIYLEEKEFDKALIEARKIYDDERDWENEKFIADILSWKGDPTSLAEAIRIYERRLKEKPDDATEARIAEITLWAKFYTDAVAKYQALLEPDTRFKQNALKYGDGFINAASSAKELTAAQIRIAEKLADLKVKSGSSDPLIMARLAWVMLKVKDRERAEALLTKINVKDAKPETHKEISDVLAAGGQFTKAIQLLENPRTNQERLEVARLYAGAKEWDSAIAQINVVIADKNAEPALLKEARHLLADVVSYKGEHQRAIDMFAALHRDYPNEPVFEIREAEITLWAKQYDKALPLFQALYERYPNDPKIWQGYASTVAALAGNNVKFKVTPILPETAILTIKRIAERVLIAATPPEPELLSRLALAMHYAGETEKADLFIGRALEMRSQDPVVRRELANTLTVLKRYKDAIDQFSSIALTPDDRRRLIDIATEGEDLDLAVRQARFLVRQDPTNRTDKKILADVLAWRGDFSESIALFEQLLKDQPKDVDLANQVADVWLWWRHYPEALVRYSKLLAARPDEVYLGFIDAASSAPNLSPEQSKQVIQIFDRYKDKIMDPARMSRLASVLTKIGRGDDADYLLDRAIAMKPANVNVRKELANVLAARDRIPEALAMFASVEDSLNFDERTTYAILLTSSGTKEDLNEAERQFRILIDSDIKPRDAELRIRYAEMLKWGGKYDKRRYALAQKEFESLARDYPQDIRFPIEIAQCLLWSGKYDQSLPKFQDLLDNHKITNPKLERDVWMGFCDSVAGVIGELLTKAGLDDENPKRYLQQFLTDKLQLSIDRAFRRAPGLKPEPVERITERYISELRYYSESLARLGLSLGQLGQGERSRVAFEQAISLNRTNTKVWEQYAQSLTLLGDYRKAGTIYDALKVGRVPEELPR